MPMMVVRIEPPTMTVRDLRMVPGLTAIELHPPAAGPEIELVFDVQGEAPEALRDRVETATGCRVLALAVRRVKA